MAPPQLRNLVRRNIAIDIGVAIVLGVGAGLLWKFGVQLPSKNRYLAFYKDYNAEEVAKKWEANRCERINRRIASIKLIFVRFRSLKRKSALEEEKRLAYIRCVLVCVFWRVRVLLIKSIE